MSSPIPSAKTVPLVALQEDITPGSVSEQTANLICRQPHQAEVTIPVGKVGENDKTMENGQNEAKMAEMQPVQSHNQKTEEKALLTEAQKDQTPASKHVKFPQPVPSPLSPTQLSFTSQPDPCHQTQHFQVHIHKVQSRQSLSQNGEQRFQIIFTKSQINIPLEYQGTEDDEQKERKERLAGLESASCSIRPSTDDDFYVNYLQEKWAKREHEQQQLNLLINNLQHDYQQSKTAPNSMKQSISNNQIITAPKSNQSQTHKIPYSLTKKTQFKVKKIHDKHTLSTINLKNNPSHSQIQPTNLSSNKSELIDSKNHYLKPYNYNRAGKKHVSNFDGSPNKYLTKPSIYKKQIDPNVQYEISEGNGIEMMSHILEDRCYNNGGDKGGSENVEGKADGANKIRKIIKRSPYGILEIEVKDKKNNAKITNLRILKPKEMSRLKKMPNLIKGNKENTASGPVTKEANMQSQKEKGQGGLPLLNCNRK